MAYKIEYTCVCNIGKRRTENQDNFICNGRYRELEEANLEEAISGVISSENPELIGIFDGMGGESCGEIASILAAKKAARIEISKNPASDLLQLCYDANDTICAYADTNGIDTMGTTAALLLFSEKVITLCNIGDSKIFRCSKDGFYQISVDHVLEAFPGKKAPLTQHLGIPKEEMIISPYITQGKYCDGDIYIISSDGLTDMVPVDQIHKIVRKYSVKESAKVLLQEALENGGRDNITIIVCKVEKQTLWKWISTKR